MNKSSISYLLQLLSTVVFLAFMLGNTALNAQIQSNKGISGYAGRYFLVGFMQNELTLLPGGIRLSIQISTTKSTTVRIAGPITSTSQFLQLPGDTVISITFPFDKVEMYESEIVQSKAIEIESDQPITVSGMSSQSLSTDGFSAIPVSKWGREYVIHSWPNDIYMHNDDPQGKIPRSSEFLIIASENNTVIEFSPRSRTMRQVQPGASTIITLNKGQCYLVKSDTLPSGQGDLSGTIVRGDKPIGVFSGHIRTAIPLGLTEFDSKNHLIEMLYPTEQWGRSFITVPFTTDGMGDFFRIHCIEPNTKVTVEGWNIDQSFTLTEPGDFKTLSFIRDPIQVKSDKPISIAQYMTSSFSSNELLQQFDPCMMLIPSTEKAITKANFHVVSNPTTNPKQFSQHFISLVCTEDAIDHVMLDKRLIRNIVSNLPSQRINGTQMYYATVPVTPGFHQLSTMEGAFIAGLYGIGSDDAYAYPLAFGMVQGIDTLPPKITMQDSCGIIKGVVEEVLKDEYSGLYDVNVIRDSTFNMNWSTPGLRDGDITSSFSGAVINRLKDAQFLIEAIDNAGNMKRMHYTYYAPKISFPDSITFGTLIAGDSVCKEIVVRNLGKASILIKHAMLSGDSRIKATYSGNMINRIIAPNDSVVITLCYHAELGLDSAFATLHFTLDCGIKTSLFVSGLLEQPSIQVLGYDFGTVSVGNVKNGSILIINNGGTTFTAHSVQRLNPLNVFTFDTTGLFPIIVKPRDTISVNCTFTPPSRIGYAETFTIMNDRNLPNQAEVIGNGATPAINGFIIDWKKQRIIRQYDTLASITNTGNDDAVISLDAFTHLDSVFLTSFPLSRIDTILKANETIPILASFIPRDTLLYQYSGIIYFSNGFTQDSTEYTLLGSGVMPGIEQKDIYVGRIKENTSKDTSGMLFAALGNAPLTVQSFRVISGDSSSFVLDTNGILNNAFAPNSQYIMPIRFIPQRSGRHQILVETISDAGIIGSSTISRSIIYGDADPIDTIDISVIIEPIDTLHVCEERLIVAQVYNNGNIEISMDSINTIMQASLRGSTITITSISDSIISPRGGPSIITLLLQAQTPGLDSFALIVHYRDTMELTKIIPFQVKTNHINIDPNIKQKITYFPGNTIELTISGNYAVSSKSEIGFEPLLEIIYNPSAIECKSNSSQFDILTNNGMIRIPMQVVHQLGSSFMNAQTQTTLKGQGNWLTTVEFDTYLTGNPDLIKIVLKNKLNGCIIGDTTSIPLEISDVCGEQMRGVTKDIKGKGLLGVYPHPMPVNGYIAMLYDEDSQYYYEIKNHLGYTMLQKHGTIQAGYNKLSIDADSLPSGAYILIFHTVKHQWTEQFIISK